MIIMIMSIYLKIQTCVCNHAIIFSQTFVTENKNSMDTQANSEVDMPIVGHFWESLQSTFSIKNGGIN